MRDVGGKMADTDKFGNQIKGEEAAVVVAEVELDSLAAEFTNERSIDQAIEESTRGGGGGGEVSTDATTTAIAESGEDLPVGNLSADYEHLTSSQVEMKGGDDDFGFPLDGDSGFNESEIFLSALESDLKLHSEQMESFCSGLTDERKAEFDALKQNKERLLANVEMLKSSVEQKLKSVESLESQLCDARTSLHNEKTEQMKQLLSKDEEIAELKRQLTSAKASESQARAEVEEIVARQAEQARKENQLECDRLKEKLKETEEALRKAGERSEMLDRSVGSVTSAPVHLEATSETTSNEDQMSAAGGDSLLSIEDLPATAFHRTPVKFIDKLRRFVLGTTTNRGSEAERERLESELQFVQVRLKE